MSEDFGQLDIDVYEREQTVSVPVEPVVINAEQPTTDSNIENYTENGEITRNAVTGEYVVWDEIYLGVVCTTQYPKVAEAALKAYAINYL